MIIGNLFNKARDVINSKIEENNLYKQKLEQSLIFVLNNDVIVKDANLVEGNWYEYCDMCSYLNLEQAKVIDGLIPLNETVINIVYSIQKKDNQKFFIIFTNFRVFVINNDKFGIYNYDDIKNVEYISKGIMSQIVSFNNIILEIDVNQNDFNVFYNLITNIEYCNSYIIEKTKYLCGLSPIYQKINKIKSGISIDINNNVVFHNKKINNYLCRYQDILNYELLEDNNVVLKRRTREDNHTLRSAKKDCYKMSLRITLLNMQVFYINILEPTIFGSNYSHMNSNYINNYNFVKEIFDKLDSMNEELNKYKNS